MITKKDKAAAAHDACFLLANDAIVAGDDEQASGLHFWAGYFKCLERFSGYLSTKDIQSEIDDVSETHPDFTLAYEMTLKEKK